jgi:ABC-type antimicrobial peptide transport system permease subunit
MDESTFESEKSCHNAHIPLFEPKTMDEHLGLALYMPRVLAVILTLFGSLALALAGVGLYSVIAFSVAQRNREMGIRVALGAGTKEIIPMVLKEGLILILVGIVVGLVISVAAMQPLSGLLIGVSAIDPITFAGVSLLLATVALFAGAIPARRAAKLDPVKALRCE